MSRAVIYLDTSAFVKLIVAERGSAELREALVGHDRVASALLAVEGERAARRHDERMSTLARVTLAAVTLPPIDDATVRRAAAIGPPSLRSLAATHLATALALSNELIGFCCYDERLGEAAGAAGLRVIAPGG